MSSKGLTDEEDLIFGFVRDYLKKKPLFSLEELSDFIAHRLRKSKDFNRNKILLMLKTFLKKKLMLPGSKLVKDDILTIPKRVEILDFIGASPGTTKKEIMDSNQIGSNHAVWHLKYLEKFEFIRTTKFGNQKAYFKADFDNTIDEIFFYLRKTKVKKRLIFQMNDKL